MSDQHKVWAVVPAGGTGKRMCTDMPKQYLKLHGKSVLHHTLSRICANPLVNGVIAGIGDDDTRWSLDPFTHVKFLGSFSSGKERANTVLNGLNYLSSMDTVAQTDWALVHDAVRPCIAQQDIENVVAQAKNNNGAVLGRKLMDTLKISDQSGLVQKTMARDKMWCAYTPQVFRIGELIRAIEKSLANGVQVTDESMAMENAGIYPCMVEGHPSNIKITVKQDLALMKVFLEEFG